MPRIPMVSGRVARVEFNGSPEFVPGSVEVPVEAIQAEGQRVVGFAKRAVQFQGLDRRGLRFWQRLLRSHHRILPVAQQRIRVGQARVGLRVFRILVDGLVEIRQRHLQTIRRSLVPEVAPLEIQTRTRPDSPP